MHIDGDWYVEHIGDKFEYHKGDTYIHEIGTTHIEKEGTIANIQTGDLGWKIDGNVSQLVTQNIRCENYLDYIKIVGQDTWVDIGRNLVENIEGYAEYTIKNYKSITINRLFI